MSHRRLLRRNSGRSGCKRQNNATSSIATERIVLSSTVCERVVLWWQKQEKETNIDIH